jgi:hypothetical protein
MAWHGTPLDFTPLDLTLHLSTTTPLDSQPDTSINQHTARLTTPFTHCSTLPIHHSTTYFTAYQPAQHPTNDFENVMWIMEGMY